MELQKYWTNDKDLGVKNGRNGSGTGRNGRGNGRNGSGSDNLARGKMAT
jgi:hypothetical protein